MTGPRSRGTWFVVPTPFDDRGSVDLESQARLVELAMAWGVDGLTAMGVTSEAAALAPAERTVALRTILEAAGTRVPVAAGCSATTLADVMALIHEAAELGAARAMVSAPPGTAHPDGLPDFFSQAARGGLPLVVQDEPAATGVRLGVPLLMRCLEASEAGVVKLEDPPTPPKIQALLKADPRLDVFGGLGGVAALYELRRGAAGTMTGFAYPEVLAAVRRAVEVGDQVRAGEVFDRYLPLIQFEAQPGIGLAVRKEILRRRGAIRSAATRVTPALDPATLRDLDDLIDRLGISPGSAAFRPEVP